MARIEQWRWKNFSRGKLACQHCGEEGVTEAFMDVLQGLRDELGIPLIVNSGYRCPQHPIEAAKAQPGEHSYGECADIRIANPAAKKLVDAAVIAGVPRIGISQAAGKPRFIHIGISTTLPEAIWSY